MIELTPDDYARCWPETRHLMDQHLDWGGVREVTAGEVDCVLAEAKAWCGPFMMHMPLPTFNASAYSHWATDSTSADARLTLEGLERAHRQLRFPDCPLLDVEYFDMQQKVIPFSTSGLDGQPRLIGIDYGSDDAWVTQWEDIFYAPRRVVRIVNIGKPEPMLRGLAAAAPERDPKSRVPHHLREQSVRLDGRRR